jgi:glucose/arabinose dehydrogenase
MLPQMPRRALPLLVLVLVASLAACGAGGAGAASDRPAARTAAVGLVRIGNFDDPLYVTAPPGDSRRVFVVNQSGTIDEVLDGRKLDSPFLDISGSVSCCGERGLLSMAFAPDYATTGRFYVDYTDRSGDTRVVEYRRAGSSERAAVSSPRLVLFQRQPESNHNGGLVIFGPDRLLYIGLGDGGGANDRHGARGNGQNLGTLLGKILRIDPRASGRRSYRIPASNPFVKRRGARGEIYAYGLRNPWRFSFDRASGDIAIGDVGQSAFEEIDFARRGKARGANYGWRVFEGNRRNYAGERARNAVKPVITYGTGSGGTCAVTGGYVVRDPGLASLRGSYVYGDFCAGVLRSARLRAGGASQKRSLGLHVSQLSSFGEDARGRVYATSLDGPVYRLTSR